MSLENKSEQIPLHNLTNEGFRRVAQRKRERERDALERK